MKPPAVQYRMPAEWEPHAATWLAWPHKRESWPGIFERIPPVWAETLVYGVMLLVLVVRPGGLFNRLGAA